MKFIIPKNFKMGKYFLNKYRVVDLIILIAGCLVGLFIAVSLVMITLDTSITYYAAIGIIIGFIICSSCIILTINLSGYFNILEFFISMIEFYKNERTYIWYGIDYTYEEDDKNV